MAFLLRRQLLDVVAAIAPEGEVETVFAEALAASGLKDQPVYRPEEVATLGETLMAQAGRMYAAAPGV